MNHFNRLPVATIRAACCAAIAVACGCARDGHDESVRNALPAADQRAATGECGQLPDARRLRELLQQAPASIEAGGMAGAKAEWGAVVDRQGRICSIAVATEDVTAAWPGSRSVAMAKAFTANAFSSDAMPLSTARMYTLGQPGQSLWGLTATNPFNPECMGALDETPAGKICGGIVTFGGGVPLYLDGRRVGGLGVSGDTACADHEIARQIRQLASLNPPMGAMADDIQYAVADGPSVFVHPLCPNTWRNGRKIGDAPASHGY